MALPTTTPLGATEVARAWKMDVDLSPLQDGSGYARLMGTTELTFNPGTAGMQSDTDYDGDGYASSTATTLEWGATATLRRAAQRSNPGAYDPAQEAIRLAATKTGAGNSIRLRAYKYSGPGAPQVEAYEGFATVAYSNGGGGPDALSTASVTITGQAALVPIAHPASTPAVVPVVSSVAYGAGTNLPSATGGLIVLTGFGFSSVTAVTVFGTSAPDYEVISDSKLAVRAPAHAAGTGNVTVTNSAGTSVTSAANQVVYV